MSLPFYQKEKNNTSHFKVQFVTNSDEDKDKLLNPYIIRIGDGFIVFGLSIENDNTIVPLREIFNMIEKTRMIYVYTFSETGQPILTIKYTDVRFKIGLDTILQYGSGHIGPNDEVHIRFTYSTCNISDTKGVIYDHKPVR